MNNSTNWQSRNSIGKYTKHTKIIKLKYTNYNLCSTGLLRWYLFILGANGDADIPGVNEGRVEPLVGVYYN